MRCRVSVRGVANATALRWPLPRPWTDGVKG